MAQVRSTSSTRVAPETRLIRAGARDCDLVKTVAPPIQKGSTVLLPNAAALYDDDAYLTYGRAGLLSPDSGMGMPLLAETAEKKDAADE